LLTSTKKFFVASDGWLNSLIVLDESWRRLLKPAVLFAM